jgi:hypothetical protein
MILYTTAEIGENIWLDLYGFNPLGMTIAYGSGFGNVLAGVIKRKVIERTIDGVEECLKGLSRNILDLKNILHDKKDNLYLYPNKSDLR